VTQAFNTTTSMGLTLNILLSFAQFEREVIGERIRVMFAASRKRGLWMGGFVPLGSDAGDRKLVISEEEAETVRHIFQRFVELGSATLMTRELVTQGVVNTRAKLVDKDFLYKLFRNRVYLGEAVHKRDSYPGEHQAVVARELWDQVHALCRRALAAGRRGHAVKRLLCEGADAHRRWGSHDAECYEEGHPSVSLLHLNGRGPEPWRGREKPLCPPQRWNA
jgi:hypothetical protein